MEVNIYLSDDQLERMAIQFYGSTLEDIVSRNVSDEFKKQVHKDFRTIIGIYGQKKAGTSD